MHSIFGTTRGRWLPAMLLGALPAVGAYAADAPGAAAPADSAASQASAPAPAGDDELRNTVINILEALVQKGVLTRDQATQIVTDAQAKAGASARDRLAKGAANAADETTGVRVTYVPQIVRDQIATQVSSSLRKEVAAQVVQQAKNEHWGVPGALPDWIRNVRFYGDVRFRLEDAMYAKDNTPDFYLNFQAINAAGGLGKVGTATFINTGQDRPRMVSRLRFGGVAKFGETLSADFRFASGNPSNAISTNQTLGAYGSRWQVGVDKAALLWNPHARTWRQELDLRMGRFDNPFAIYNELIFDQDLMFEGISATFDWNRIRGWNEHTSRWLFATAGIFPLQEIELSTRDKWLYGGQIGTEIPFSYDSKLRLAVAVYNFANVTGQLNAPDSKLLDYTAPASLQKGNTLFDIRNDTDPSTNLYALAGKYRLLTGLVQLDVLAFGENHVILSGEYVKNIGWKSADVLARTGVQVAAHTKGYEFGLSVGRPKVSMLGQWRSSLSYRYLERDAVLDSFTDSDFHLGGTDAAGYILTFDYGLGRSAFARVRYLSANAIDGAPLGIDVAQVDLVGQF